MTWDPKQRVAPDYTDAECERKLALSQEGATSGLGTSQRA
jgi:hypothetical protein